MLGDLGIQEVVSEQVAALYVVHFDTRCSHCHDYIEVMARVFARMKSGEYGHRFALVLVNAGEQSDNTIREFIRQHNIPEAVPVIGGLSAEYNDGVPKTIFMMQSRSEGWTHVGSLPGALEEAFLYESVMTVITYLKKVDDLPY